MTSLRLLLLSAIIIMAMVLIAGCGDSETAADKADARGLRLVLQADPGPRDMWPSGAADRERVMKSVADYAREQVKLLTDDDHPDVRVIDPSRIAIVLPAGANPASVVSRLTGRHAVSKLEFYYMARIRSKANPLGEWMVDMPGDGYVFTDSHNRTINSVKQPAAVLKDVVGAPQIKPVLSGDDLKRNASVNTNSRNQIVLQIQFNKAGTKKFADFTRSHIGEYLAIFYNGKLLTCPVIREAIVDGKGEISGFTSLDEAKKAADSLNASGIPIPLKVAK